MTQPERSLSRGRPLFTVLGFEIRLNLSWLVLGLLIVWTLAIGFFPQGYPDLAPATYWWMGIAGAVGILFSIVFHELSHSLVARRFGLPIGGITLFIFGGIAEMREEPDRPSVEFLMAAAGPLASFVLAGAVYLLHLGLAAAGGPAPVLGVLYYLAIVNVVLGVFNLVPAFPLDGGRMLRAALWAWRRDLNSATRTSSRLGALFGLALMIAGAVSFITGNLIAGLWWVLIGAFLRAAASTSYRQLVARQFLAARSVGQLMNTHPAQVDPQTTLSTLVEHHLYPSHQRVLPVVADGRLLGCVTLDAIRQVPRDQWPQRTAGEVMRPCAHDDLISPAEDGAALMNALTGSADPREPKLVVENDALVGAVSLDDLRRTVALRMELETGSRA
ncbi:MAG TPA: site-2 protease family protein [Steroidobacteraceae bacterium]|nr:site-2 protease family protein [Steroidobacteraceae bacterium]